MLQAANLSISTSTRDLHWNLPDGRPVESALPNALVDPNEEERARLQRFFWLP